MFFTCIFYKVRKPCLQGHPAVRLSGPNLTTSTACWTTWPVMREQRPGSNAWCVGVMPTLSSDPPPPPPDKIPAILETIFSDALSWIEKLCILIKIHWNMFLRVHLTTIRHWFKRWHGVDQMTSHYLTRLLSDSLTHICDTRRDEYSVQLMYCQKHIGILTSR